MNLSELDERLNKTLTAITPDVTTALDKLNLPLEAKLLDVGTGEGMFAICLASRGYSVITGEPSSDQTHYANKDWQRNAETVGVGEKITFRHFAAQDIPFSDSLFDAVFFFGVLHHIDEIYREKAFLEAVRVVKEGAAVVFFEPTETMVAEVRSRDPGHPDPANPDEYSPAVSLQCTKIAGQLMDIYIYTT